MFTQLLHFQNTMHYIELDATLSCDEKEEFHDENLEGRLKIHLQKTKKNET